MEGIKNFVTFAPLRPTDQQAPAFGYGPRPRSHSRNSQIYFSRCIYAAAGRSAHYTFQKVFKSISQRLQPGKPLKDSYELIMIPSSLSKRRNDRIARD
ncbi:hypothetical protein GWI33_002447 [Rhynchophorus ferrugineus]|uniref:Uncharacterized protein n=1 Tax=Rhynchophorus ferrugineus TaxID=354439 RepID=A0A834IZD1_RHYFE|nr:hypothetical protein GWI33_002447 [Rhynchophorus ferrugineus]